jgi:hypothetical protein
MRQAHAQPSVSQHTREINATSIPTQSAKGSLITVKSEKVSLATRSAHRPKAASSPYRQTTHTAQNQATLPNL